MDKAIITVLLIIAGVVCVAVMFNGIFPAITRGSDAVVSMASKVDDRLQSQVNMIYAVSEYDSDEALDWRDANSNGTFDLLAWVKNVGSTRILGLERCDIFFGEEGDFRRIPYTDYAGGTPPYWEYSIEDSASEWGPAKTLKVTIRYATLDDQTDNFSLTGLSSNTTYLFKLIIPNGITDEIYFSL